MVMGVGKAVKYNKAIQQHQRMYLVRGMMGVATTTNDAAGDFSRVSPYYHITEKSLREACNEVFVGKIQQTLPTLPNFKFLQRYRPSSDNNINSILPVKQADVHITAIDVIEFDPPSFQLHVHTEGRIYPCSLINDLGEVLDSAAHLTHLCRVQQVQNLLGVRRE
eukprot:sb/3472567/